MILTVLFCPVPARATSPHDWRTGSETELAEGGFFVQANAIWPPRTPLDLLLTFPGDRLPVRLSGVVSWARAGEPSGMFVAYAEERPTEAPTRERLSALGRLGGAGGDRAPEEAVEHLPLRTR